MFILAGAAIMQPLLSFGIQDTIIKFYSTYKSEAEKGDFLTAMLMFPLLIIIPVAIVISSQELKLMEFLTKENGLIEPYAWLIFFIGISQAYFEIFFSWCKVQLKSVFGNFMKEVFMRVAVFNLLLAVYYDLLSLENYLYALTAIYILRTVIMMWYAYYLKLPAFKLNIPDNFNEIFKYSAFIVAAASVVVVLMEVDKWMIGLKLPGLNNVAYYGVAVFIATVIAVPTRSLNQIAATLTANYINKKQSSKLKNLYQKSSLNLFVIGGFIFLLVVLNINELYSLLEPGYEEGVLVVILIAFTKLMDNLMGNNNAILYNSSHYKVVLGLGIGLAILTIVLNIIFIPIFGIVGAAIATVIAMFLYNCIKLYVVWKVFKIQPFQNEMLITLSLLLGFCGIFASWDFPFHAIINIALKSILIGGAYIALTYYFKVSADINLFIDDNIKKLS
jgi:O-antigen/teichoic acid export membrane protein